MIVAWGPMRQRSPMLVAPRSVQPCSSTVSAPMRTPASTIVVWGLSMVTPLRMWWMRMRRRASAVTSARSARSLTPNVSVASSTT